MRLQLIVLLILTSYSANAQRTTSVGIYYNQFYAADAYRANTTRNPLGGAISVLFSKPESMLDYGLEIGAGLHSGKKYYYQTIDLGVSNNIDYIYEENGFIYYHVSMKIRPKMMGAFFPYGEVRAGLSSFFSALRSMQYSDAFEDRFQFDDIVLSGYVGAGIKFDLGKQEWQRRLMMDSGFGYLISDQATYRNSEKQILIQSFDQLEHHSNVNSWQVRLGLNVVF